MFRLFDKANEVTDSYLFNIFRSDESVALNKIKIAIKSENTAELDQLLKLNKKNNIANINWTFPQLNDKTILMIACEEGSIQCIKVLLDNNADLNIFNCYGNSALLSVCISENLELLNYLISRGIATDDYLISSCFERLIKMNKFKSSLITKALVARVQNITRMLHQACASGYTDLVRFLLDSGADRTAINVDGHDALYFATGASHSAVVKMLLEWGSEQPLSANSINKAFIQACSLDNAIVVRYLLEHGADRSTVDRLGHDALYIASEKGHVDVAKALLAQNEPVPMSSINTALRAACKSSRVEVAAYLIERGVDVNLADERGDCPLAYAVSSPDCQPPLVKLLIKAGADIHALDHGGTSMLTLARRPEIVTLMLEHGVEVHIGEYNFDTAMNNIYNILAHGTHISPTCQLVLEVQALSARGADVTSPLKDGTTILLRVILMSRSPDSDDLKFIAWLLDRADVNTIDPGTGDTVLMLAANNRRVDLVRLLLERGADVTQLNHAGKAVLDYVGSRPWYSEIDALCKQYLEVNRPVSYEEMEILLK